MLKGGREPRRTFAARVLDQETGRTVTGQTVAECRPIAFSDQQTRHSGRTAR